MTTNAVYVNYTQFAKGQEWLDILPLLRLRNERDFEAGLVEFDDEDDPVQLWVNYPLKVSVSNFVNSLKGVSSRMIRKRSIQVLPGSQGKGRCGHLPISRVVLVMRLLRSLSNTLSNHKNRNERQSCSR